MHIKSLVVRTGVPLPPPAGPERTRFCLHEGMQKLYEARRFRSRTERLVAELQVWLGGSTPSVWRLGSPASGRLLAYVGELRVAEWFSFRKHVFVESKARGTHWRAWASDCISRLDDLTDAALTAAAEAFRYLSDVGRDVQHDVQVDADGVVLGELGTLISEAHELVHIVSDIRGGLVGCPIEYDDGVWYQTCRCDLLHVSLGNSAGFTSRRICRVCHADFGQCDHLPGLSYSLIAGRTAEGHCTVCGSAECDHVIGSLYEVAGGYVLTDIELHEVSLVNRPRDPLARITARELSAEDLQGALGRMPSPGEFVLDHACMYQCHGFLGGLSDEAVLQQE